MPKIDLPPDSLGPKPTKKQMELLRKSAEPGVLVHTWEGVTMGSSGAYFKHEDQSMSETLRTEKINRGDVSKFYDYGWLDHVDGDFRGHNYRISERGRKVIAKGKTR